MSDGILTSHGKTIVFSAITSAILSFLITSSMNQPSTQTNPNKYKIGELETKIQILETRNNTLGSEVGRLRFQVYNLTKKTASFTPSSTGFSTVSTHAGNLVVSLQDIKKYANGYKLVFDIGNPTLATFHDASMNITWNKDWDTEAQSFEEWQANQRSTQITLGKTLLPGRWNVVTVIISPAKEDDIAAIDVELVTNTISLSNDYRQ